MKTSSATQVRARIISRKNIRAHQPKPEEVKSKTSSPVTNDTNPSEVAKSKRLASVQPKSDLVTKSDDNENLEIINPEEVDPSTKYIISASIVEMLHNKPKLIDKVLDRPQGLTFAIFKRMGGGGAFLPKENTICFNSCLIWRGVYIDNDQNNPIIHEFMHAVDAERKNTQPPEFEPDGIFEEMNDDQKSRFIEARDSLFNTHNQFWDSSLGTVIKLADENRNPEQIDRATGLRMYAFSNKEEFAADTVASYYENSKAVKQASPELYNVYKEFFGFDPYELKKDELEKKEKNNHNN